MKVEITILLAIATFIMGALVNFSRSRKDTEKESEARGYSLGKLDTRLNTIESSLKKIEQKLDNYDKDMEKKVNLAIENHVKLYHSSKNK